MTSRRRPPTFIPSTPWSQPWMTWPWPSGNENGSPVSHDASNCRPFNADTPTYWTVTVLPDVAVSPSPTLRSSLTSEVGSLPSGTSTCGLVGAGVSVAVGEDALSSPSSPHPAAITAKQARSSARVRRMAPEGRSSAVGAEDAVARVAQPWPDVAVVVELAVHGRGEDRDVGVRLLQRGHTLGRRHQAHEPQPPRAGALEPRDRLRGAAAGGQHRVDDEHLGLVDAGRHVLVVADGPQRLLVAVHAEMADAGVGHEAQEPVHHAQAGAQDRDDHDLVGQPDAGGGLERRLDLEVRGPQRAHRLVGEDHRRLVERLPEAAVRGLAISEDREEPPQQDVVDHGDAFG